MYLPQYETSLGHITRLMFLKQYHNFLVVRLYIVAEDEGKSDLDGLLEGDGPTENMGCEQNEQNEQYHPPQIPLPLHLQHVAVLRNSDLHLIHTYLIERLK